MHFWPSELPVGDGENNGGNRLATVWFSLGLGTFELNPNLDYQVRSSRLVNPNPEPLEPGSIGSGSGLNLNSIEI